MTFHEFFEIFTENPILLEFKGRPEEYCEFLEKNNWEVESYIASYFILSELTTLIETGELKTGTLHYFDQNASGPSIISILSNSKKLAMEVNMISEELEKPSAKIKFENITSNCVYTGY